MPDPKIIDFPLGLPLTTILQGESFYCDFDLTELFGKVIDTTDYDDVKIYLYHKQLLKNIAGFEFPLDDDYPVHEYWGDVDGNITGVDSDQARIKVSAAMTEENKTGTYMYLIVLEDDLLGDYPVYEKNKGDAFIIKTAIDE